MLFIKAQREYSYIRYIESELVNTNEERSIIYSDKKLILVNEVKKKGFSAGNNVGIRYALNIGAESVLIVNPDVEFIDPNSIDKLMKTLFLEARNYIVAPRVKDPKNRDKNPLKTSSFLGEIFQPARDLFKKISKVESSSSQNNSHNACQVVDKV